MTVHAATGAQRQRLQDAAGQLNLPLPDAVCDRLLSYLALLERWNRVYNLTAVRDAAEMLERHLVDCIAIIGPLRRQMYTLGISEPRVLDVGSGGGLPGVVIACFEPAWSVDCVDAVAKKASFIRQVALEVGLPRLRGLHSRVEALTDSHGLATSGYQLIISRAFASLAHFTEASSRLLAQNGVWVAMKAKLAPAEMAELSSKVNMFHVEQLQLPAIDADRCLVWMRTRVGPS